MLLSNVAFIYSHQSRYRMWVRYKNGKGEKGEQMSKAVYHANTGNNYLKTRHDHPSNQKSL